MTQQQPQQLLQGENLGPRKLINRTEYIRLIEQALHKLGFSSVAQQLEQASGVQMQPVSATLFQQRLLAGEWEGALQLLPSLLEGQAAVSNDELRDARFLIRQQQYLEAVEAGDTGTALDVLRSQLAPLAGSQHAHRLHHLAGLLLVPRPSDVGESDEARARWASWLGGGLAHRSQLLAQMQAALPPWLMIPEGRLEVLLEQALDTQIARCPFHNLATGGAAGSVAGMLALQGGLSLLSDYQAGAESLPSRCVQVLDAHTDEVWHLAFSHSGALLATGSKDRTAIVWTVKPPPPCAPSALTGAGLLGAGAGGTAGAAGGAGAALPALVHKLHTLQGHEAPVLFLSWSPDDAHLLSVSDVTLRLWDPSTGALKHTYTHHKEAVTCCAWFPDSTRFVSGSVDRTLALLDCNGRELQRFKRAYRVQDLAVTAGGSVLVIAASDKHIHILRLSDQREVTLAEASPITSIDLSADGRHLLANLQSQAVHLWHLGSLELPPGVLPSAAHAAATAGAGAGGGLAGSAQAAASGQPALRLALPAGTSDPLDKLPPEPAAEYREPGTEANSLGRYVVRSSFGGAAGNFVVHGSEGGQVFVWHRDSATLLLQLEGHTATVNACAWPPAAPQLLASASDDRTVRVWLAEAALASAARGPPRA